MTLSVPPMRSVAYCKESDMSRCPICNGEFWVCENHLNVPASKCDCGGAACNCVCNPDGIVEWDRCIESINPDEITKLH